uniref:Basic leucine zipper transcriptional factor ATF-like n=1 Tax=Chelydra serpentina TaxID=8475 RepID=A0A8C3RKW5_CHESE
MARRVGVVIFAERNVHLGLFCPCTPDLMPLYSSGGDFSVIPRTCIFQDSSDDMRKVQRREKNRIAAQKSRQRQTQKADTLHLESEDLERQNAALRREIKQLTEEMKHFTSMLSSHEPLCSILTTVPQPPPEVLYATHSFHQPHISSPRFQH